MVGESIQFEKNAKNINSSVFLLQPPSEKTKKRLNVCHHNTTAMHCCYTAVQRKLTMEVNFDNPLSSN
jgi:hypothetical protein